MTIKLNQGGRRRRDGSKESLMDGDKERRECCVMKGCRGGEEKMLRGAKRDFIAIITLDGISEAALLTHCLFVCVNMRQHTLILIHSHVLSG